MDAGTAKRLARDWVISEQSAWPGFRAAHLVGGLATLPDQASFPAYKDVDLHLILAEGSPALQSTGPFLNILETKYAGIIIEAGIKSEREYASPEVVLSNPEIAYHLTVASTLSDPQGLLANLAEPVRRSYRRRCWVQARVAFERTGLEGTLRALPVVRAASDLSGAFLTLGYSCIYAAAALSVAALRPPRIGSQVLVSLRGLLAEYGHPMLYEDVLGVFGVQRAAPERVAPLLREGAELFDHAVRVRRTPHPFQHKLHAHLRPYFVDSCAAMLAAGDHREALAWLAAYYLACCDVLCADGPEEEKPARARQRGAFLAEFGITSEAAFAVRLEQAHGAHAGCFALANEILASHTGIID